MDNLIQMSNHLKNYGRFNGFSFKRQKNKSRIPPYPGLAPLRGQGPGILPFLRNIYIFFIFFQFLQLPGTVWSGEEGTVFHKKTPGRTNSVLPGEVFVFIHLRCPCTPYGYRTFWVCL